MDSFIGVIVCVVFLLFAVGIIGALIAVAIYRSNQRVVAPPAKAPAIPPPVSVAAFQTEDSEADALYVRALKLIQQAISIGEPQREKAMMMEAHELLTRAIGLAPRSEKILIAVADFYCYLAEMKEEGSEARREAADAAIAIAQRICLLNYNHKVGREYLLRAYKLSGRTAGQEPAPPTEAQIRADALCHEALRQYRIAQPDDGEAVRGVINMLVSALQLDANCTLAQGTVASIFRGLAEARHDEGQVEKGNEMLNTALYWADAAMKVESPSTQIRDVAARVHLTHARFLMDAGDSSAAITEARFVSSLEPKDPDIANEVKEFLSQAV